MKKSSKYILTIVLPLTGLAAFLGACASMSTCNNDACYERNVSSVDPYKKGDIAAWGTEKQVAEQEDAEMRRSERMNDRKVIRRER